MLKRGSGVPGCSRGHPGLQSRPTRRIIGPAREEEERTCGLFHVQRLGFKRSTLLGCLQAVAVLASLGTAPAFAKKALTVCAAGPPTCRYATIQDALGAASNGDDILIAAGTYDGGFTITKSVDLIGAGANVTTISGGDPAVMRISPAAKVEIEDLTITAGDETGIVNDGTLELHEATVASNALSHEPLEAAGMLNRGRLKLVDSTISDNPADHHDIGVSTGGSPTTASSTCAIAPSRRTPPSGPAVVSATMAS